jgi:membrane-bound ClpP family serine protease
MSIGSGIVLFVIGAILAFAIQVQITGIDLHLIGDILMGAGVIVFIIGLIFTLRKRSSVTTVSNGTDANGNVVQSRRTDVTPDDRI